MILLNTITSKAIKRFDDMGFGNQMIIVGTKHKDLKEFICDEIEVALETVRGEVEKRKKEYPKDIVQDIWSPNGNTRIVSPDVFGRNYVVGHNNALDQVLSLLSTQKNLNK